MNRSLAISNVALVLLCAAAQAQTSKCIEEKITAQTEKYYIDGQGEPASRLVELGKVASGDEAVYTILIRNSCAQPATNVVIDEPVPDHMTYTKTTAKGDGTDRVFSVDGTTFARWDALSVKDANGSSRPAEPQDIKIVRWIFKGAINPGESDLLHFHATAK